MDGRQNGEGLKVFAVTLVDANGNEETFRLNAWNNDDAWRLAWLACGVGVEPLCIERK